MEGSGGQCYCLRWNNYQSSVVAVMRTLLHDGAFLDVTLACDGRSLQAHRLMLASCSDFFSSLLKDNQTEHPIIFLRDVSFWELEAIMDFMYNGQVNIMQEQLPGFIRTAEALQIKGLAAVNNNNNSENFSLKHTPHLQDLKYSALTSLNNNNNSSSNNNSVAENLSQKYNAHLNELKYKASSPHNNNSINNNNNNNNTSINNNNTDNFSLKYNPVLKSYTVSQNTADMGTDHHVPAGLPSPSERDSPPPGGGKRRRHESHQHHHHRDSDITSRLLESPSQAPSPPTSEGSPLKGSSPFSINDTIHSLALSAGNPANAITSVASMASISVAKAISLSKLVHEISSQASIASLKSAALPPHHTALPPDDVNGWGDEGHDLPEPHTPPPFQQPPQPHVHNTKDWAANKNEDGFPACSLCGKVFKHQGSLVAHYQVHQQRTKCPVCQKVLSRHYHMKVHLLTVHKVPDSEIDSLLRTQCV